MANQAQPVGNDPDRSNNDNDIDRAGLAVGPVDEEGVAGAADEAVLQSRDFPSGGEPSGSSRANTTGASAVPGGGGSTGRGATDAGKNDSEGIPGGGMAGAAGG